MTFSPLRTVVVVNDHAFVNGGQAKIAIETALILRERGLDVVYFAGVGPEDERLTRAGVATCIVGEHDILGDPSRLRAMRTGIWNGAAARRLRALLASLDPKTSIVHVHGWAKALSPSIGPVITGSPVPHLYTLHEYFLACPNGGFYDYRKHEICTRRPLGMSCLTTDCDPRHAGHKAWRVARQAVLWSAGRMPRGLRDIVYLTELQRKAIEPYLPEGARLHHLPNPIEPFFGERVRAEANDTYLFVGRLSSEKGGALVARAARKAGVRIAFAGDGEQRRAIEEANPDAIMLGWVKQEQLAEWLSRARAVVLPSLLYEGYPMVVLEAMQRGLPVLISDCTAATEFVDSETHGLHVSTGDCSAWVQAFSRMRDTQFVADASVAAFAKSENFLTGGGYYERLSKIFEACRRVR